ncbi:rhomboid family intramembrane serine protease [Polluticaenibacter yanchengensis]|uniref:Rhomboid family intramembrane serine protease n=1 Tax=Polluticaenibacter yanchengensis TaxID=3014562 RepID=A0ABT4UNX0_9BACT|nr:rhomboid family intramembrane serine protease [Chitinophagaceae bacterium LY-5]
MIQVRPSGFQVLPVIIKNLIIINVLVFLAQLTFDGISMKPGTLEPNIGFVSQTFALHHVMSSLFKPWQLITHMFMHGSPGHLFFNMFGLWLFGSMLENLWGAKRFLIFYLVCGLGAAVLHLASMYYDSNSLINDFNAVKVNINANSYFHFLNKYTVSPDYTLQEANAVLNELKINPNNFEVQNEALKIIASSTNMYISYPTVGASGAVFGCLAAFAVLFPNHIVYFFPAKYVVPFLILSELIAGFQNIPGDNVARFAHVGGAVMGLILAYFWKKRSHRFRRWY